MDDEMTRAFDELVARNGDLARVGVGERPRRARRDRRVRGDVRGRLPALAAVVAVLVVGGVVLQDELPGVGDRPAPDTGASSSGDHAFLAVLADGTPVTYDPCQPVRWAHSPAGAPPEALEVVREAVRETAAATGLRFVEEPETSDRPSFDAGLFGTRPGEPVLVGWADPAEVSALDGDVAGIGGSRVGSAIGADRQHWTTGAVVLDAPTLVPLLDGPGGREAVRAIVMHELGHVVGLDHVDDPGELMHDENVGQRTWGPGDREGLAALGGGGC